MFIVFGCFLCRFSASAWASVCLSVCFVSPLGSSLLVSACFVSSSVHLAILISVTHSLIIFKFSVGQLKINK